MELGLATFVDSGNIAPEQRMRNLLEEARLADELGLDVFAVGEHHRRDYLVASPPVALAAIAAVTDRIRLSSAVTVLSSDDPVRVYQQFAEVDQISGGRAEIMAGRGSFTESFPLFGYDLDDYDELFAEKLELLLQIREDPDHVTWSGRHRPPLNDMAIWPRPVQAEIPIWVAVGGSPDSVIRAGRLGLPLTLAIIGGMPERFAPLIELYRRAADASGNTEKARVAINTHAFVADSTEQADTAFAPSYLEIMNRIGRERGWPPSGIPEYRALRSPRGALAVGNAEEVAEKILLEHELFANDRYVGQMSMGSVDHKAVLRSMEIYGTEVVPVVREEVARRTGSRASIASHEAMASES
jgi:probable LLM family oxidoreductase